MGSNVKNITMKSGVKLNIKKTVAKEHYETPDITDEYLDYSQFEETAKEAASKLNKQAKAIFKQQQAAARKKAEAEAAAKAAARQAEVDAYWAKIAEEKRKAEEEARKKKEEEEDKPWWEELFGTVAVAATTVVSGVAKVVENVVDGVAWAGGTIAAGACRLVGADDAAEAIETGVMDFTATDWVGEANKAFYEGTDLGRAINDASAMKYDSELAQGIQNVTKTAVVVAAATAASVVTCGAGGVAVVAAFGAAQAAGESAEEKFKDKENRDYWTDSAFIGVDAAIGAVSAVGVGKAGAAAVSGVKNIAGSGVKNFAKDFAKRNLSKAGRQAFKDTIKREAKNIAKDAVVSTLKDPSTYLEATSAVADDVKKGIKTGDWDVGSMAAKTAGVFASNVVGNVKVKPSVDSITDALDKRDAAVAKFEKDSWISTHETPESFASKVEKADRMAGQYAKEGVMSQNTFYDVWGTDKGKRPDPSTYLPSDYIDSHKAQFKGGAARLTAESDYVTFVQGKSPGGNTVGRFQDYNSGSKTYQSSEFFSPKSSVDDLVANSKTQPDSVKYIVEQQGLGDNEYKKFKNGLVRYDVDGSEIDSLGIRIPSGNEPGAFDLDWIPGGKTSGGTPEAILSGFQLDGKSKRVSKL